MPIKGYIAMSLLSPLCQLLLQYITQRYNCCYPYVNLAVVHLSVCLSVHLSLCLSDTFFHVSVEWPNEVLISPNLQYM